MPPFRNTLHRPLCRPRPLAWALALVMSASALAAQTATELAARAATLVEQGRDDPSRLHDALRAYDAAIAADPENLDIRVELGDLFLSKYNAPDARAIYEEVLERDAEHVGALLGLARVERFDGAVDVSELLERVLERDSDNVPARLLGARQALDLEDFDTAEATAVEALERDPSAADGHALHAAVALLRGEEEAFRRRLARATEILPGTPEIFITLAEVAARNRLYSRAVELAERAVALDTKAWRGWALLGVNRLRVGQIGTGRQALEKAFDGDPFDVWTKNTLDLLDTMDTHGVVQAGRFELVLPTEEADLLALYLEPLARDAHRAMAARYGVELEAPVRIEVFSRHADFSVRTVGLVGLGALGVSFGPVVAMDSPSARPAGDFHWGATLWHELAHSFHMAASGGRVPRWFTEGLAVWEERQARPGWGDRVTPDFLRAYLDDKLAPIEDLNQGFMRPESPRQVVFSYYQASLVFDLLAERYGIEAIVAMLAGYRDGGSTEEIFVDVLEMDLGSFAKLYDAHFRERFAGPLAAMEGDFLEALESGHRLRESHPEAALAHLERAKELFPSYAGPGNPAFELARLHRNAGRLDIAEAELAALVERNRAHAPALRALVEVRTELGDLGGAARALENIPYLDPYGEDDHRRLAEHYASTGDTVAALRERRAVLALEPTNRAEALYQLARAENDAGDATVARRRVLEALEIAPGHEEALMFLLELREGAKQ